MDPLRLLLKFSWFFRPFVSFFVKPRVLNQDLDAHLSLDASVPVCYVFQNRSFVDLMVAKKLFKKHGLPFFQPTVSELLENNQSSFICLAVPGILGSKKVKVEEKLSRIISHVNGKRKDIQLVPVSIFWGRNPGKERTGALRTILFDARRGGVWQKCSQFF